jgi:predicted ABC-class ATPase
MGSADELHSLLQRLDGRSYRAYSELRGSWTLPGVELHVDHVQGDPFAAPSKLRLRVAAADAALPPELFSTRVRRIALQDFLARAARARVDAALRSARGSGSSGHVRVDAGAQEVLERSAVLVTARWVELRVRAGLPATGRRILGREAARLLQDELPRLAQRSLCSKHLAGDALRAFVASVENQEALRSRLGALGLVAFVGDGAILPRASGASDAPMPREHATPFLSPASLRVDVDVPHPDEGPTGTGSRWTGMGLGEGVSLVVGGGYHGKSTLLRAIERCVHPHVPGDGRERVVSAPGLVKVRAEDGRRVEQVDIRAFIGALPGGRETDAFSSDDASGSTSQAASIAEAIEAGATGLLLDEDSSATNLLLRDARMQALVAKRHEPIKPFVERVRELHTRLGVSTLLVIGGSGDAFEEADRVLAMRAFEAFDVTADARAIAAASPTGRRREATEALSAPHARVPLAASFDASRGRRDVRIDARGRDTLLFGREEIDLRGVEQIRDASQTRAIGCAMLRIASMLRDGDATLGELLARLDAELESEGLDGLDPHHRPGAHPGELARPRRFEIAAAINRLRSLRVRQRRGGA